MFVILKKNQLLSKQKRKEKNSILIIEKEIGQILILIWEKQKKYSIKTKVEIILKKNSKEKEMAPSEQKRKQKKSIII